jgi:hypothetical protein
MASGDRGRAEIVGFWRAVEMFSPQQVEKVDDERKVFRVAAGAPLPWTDGHRVAGVRLKPHLTWRHTVYLGCYRLERVTAALNEAYGEDPQSYDGRLDQESALAAFHVGADGIFLGRSPILSACAWATGRLLKGGSLAVEAFESAQRSLAERLGELFVPLTAADDAGPRPALDVEALTAARDMITGMLGVTGALDAVEIRVQSTEISRRRPEEVADDFLNSFIVGDLARVAGNVRSGRYGVALRSYLSGEQPARRVDVREHPEHSLTATRPQATPLGRWPSNPRHSLALSQQSAVNQIMAASGDSGIYAVNGPPGTGKTTMLRDLVAGLVVRRAEALASLQDPSEAFTGRRAWKTREKVLHVNVWRSDLVGHEIVVASSNNGAVENVSLEIPGRKAIDDRWLGEIDHFGDLATALLRAAKGRGSEPAGSATPGAPQRPEAWALVAAMLGNKKNRDRFTTNAWFGSGEEDAPPTLRDELDERAARVPGTSWPECVARFRRAVAVAAEGRDQRAAAHDAPAVLARGHRAREQAVGEGNDAAREASLIEERLRHLEAEAARAERDVHVHREARSAHHAFRPGFLWSLFDRRRLRSWSADDETHADRIREAEAGQRRLHAERDELDRALEVSREAQISAAGRRADADRTVREQEAVLYAAREAWGEAVPGPDWRTDERRRELRAPWSDPDWNGARSEVFLAALRLHHDFLSHQASAMRQNLGAAVDVLSGSAPRDLDEDVARAAWQSLFFVIPVVSTTFASIGRMFSHLTAESLGWLFVDEAGQATPQNAVGALWRCRRAVVVGDPLQLEPVVTLPFRAQQSLRRDAGVAERWLPVGNSVQTLADALMSVGTYLPDGYGGRRWVGAPLRVHRRCDDPMFTVVNRIAYDGLMLSAVGPRDELTLPKGGRALPDTKWLHVAGQAAERHWIPAEGECLRTMLCYLADHDYDMSQVMVIGPFRDVARGSTRIFRQFPGVRGGTIHTAQGKESDVVVLILGSDPGSPRARQWAASAPNLLNVAISRARRRLYVIGNRDAWQAQPYFADLAHLLPVREQ